MVAVTEVGMDIPNSYSETYIPEINNLGTKALTKCVTSELQKRELVEDPEVRWALDCRWIMQEQEQLFRQGVSAEVSLLPAHRKAY